MWLFVFFHDVFFFFFSCISHLKKYLKKFVGV
jgi:hypothetical protein